VVLEIALIDIQTGREAEFADAYRKGRPVLAGTPGCRSVRMTQGVESPTRFVLLVEWDSEAAHLENFRGTDRFARWRGIVGPFFRVATGGRTLHRRGAGHRTRSHRR
jgi:heme-degrading monooxygenase HmoA